jgi:hypothetical protein
MTMAVDIVDAMGANLWPGDAATLPAGAGTVIAVLESADDSTGGRSDLIVGSIATVQNLVGPGASTVTARAGEVPTADQAQNGVVA